MGLSDSGVKSDTRGSTEAVNITKIYYTAAPITSTW